MLEWLGSELVLRLVVWLEALVVQSLWFERHLLLLVLVLDAAVAGVAGGVLGEAGAIRVLGLLVKTVHFAGAVEDRLVGFLKLLEDLLAML